MSKPSHIFSSCGSTSLLDRRGFLIGAGAAGMALGTAIGEAYTQIAAAADYSLRIAPQRLELAPGKVIDTFAYNGMVPGPVLRLREGQQVSIDIRNDTDGDDIIHWHGLYVPSLANGAMEEGSPMVPSGGGMVPHWCTVIIRIIRMKASWGS
jgi:FtsP/CotA-like multicopper oxidase with cupredoxin domain